VKTLILLFFGALVGVGIFIYLQSGGNRAQLQGSLENKMIQLSTNEVADELARTGVVVRKKATELGNALSSAADDARTSETIMGKFAQDDKVSALHISVNTTTGLVTLSGKVSSHAEIARAIQLAMQVDGVTQVVSTLQVIR
jgi:osmotically-inducible protein OsmY